MAGNFNLTFGDVSIKEDVVLNAVEILTAKETQIMSLLPKSRAIATVHSYLTDTLRTAATAGMAETADYSAANSSTPTRYTNLVEKVGLARKVSRTQQRVEHYHGQDELSRETSKLLLDWGNAFEFDLVRSTLVSGLSGTIAKMEGIIAHTSLAKNHTSQNSGTVFSASICEGLMKNAWATSNGETPTDLFMSAGTRQALDNATQKSNIVVNQANGLTEIVKMTSVYTTAFGRLEVHTHRYVFQSGTDATDRVLGLNRAKGAVAWLQMPILDRDLSRAGDYDLIAVVGEATFEARNKESYFFADGYLIS
jgi:hypothetical protein